MKRIVYILIILASLTGSAAFPAFMEIEAKQIVSIEPADKSEAARILVKWDLPKDLGDKIIDGAVISMTIPYTGTKPVAMDAYPLSKEWKAGMAQWSSGWDRAGGDFDDRLPAPAVLTERNGGVIKADVHQVVLDQIAGKSKNFGFILVPEASAKGRIPPISANSAGVKATAKLIIAYRNRR